MKVKINNKNYDVPELTFEHFTKIEEQGFSIVEAFRKNQMLLLAMGYVCVVADCERDEAERLIEQHILGGGDLGDIISSFGKAVDNSNFFRKMMYQKAEQKKTAEETKAAVETEK